MTGIIRVKTRIGGFSSGVFALGGQPVSGPPPKGFVLIDRTAGTNIGDMTVNGGLAQAFNGTTSVASSNCALVTAAGGYVGKTLATGRVFGKAIIYGANDAGFDTRPVADTSVTLRIYGKNGTAPANKTDGTLLGTLGPFTDQTNESAGRQVDSTDLVTAWDHLWVRVEGDPGQFALCAELQLYAWE